MVAVVFLSKLADKVRKLTDPEIRKLAVEERIGETSAHRLNFHLYEDFAHRFSAEDAESIWQTILNTLRENRSRNCPICSR